MLVLDIMLVVSLIIFVIVLGMVAIKIQRELRDRSRAELIKPRKCDVCGHDFISTLPKFSYERCWDCQGAYDWDEDE